MARFGRLLDVQPFDQYGFRYEDMVNAFRRAVKLAPTLGPDVYNKLGTLYLRRLEQEEAARCWRKAMEIAPGDPTAKKNLDSLSASTK